MSKRTPDLQPLSMLPTFIKSVQEMIDTSEIQLADLYKIKNSPRILDDKLAYRILCSYAEQNNTVAVYLEQCTKWKEQNLTDIQLLQIRTLENGARALIEINNKVQSIAEELFIKAIDIN